MNSNKNKIYYFSLLIVTIISGVASGMIQVAIYNLLSNFQMSTFYFGAAFLVITIPGYFSATISTWLIHKKAYYLIIVLCYMLQILLLFNVTHYDRYSSLIKLFCLEALANIILGLMYPAIQTAIKRGFSPEHITLAARLDVYAFSIQIIFGLGLGSILINLVTVEKYFLEINYLYMACATVLYIMYKFKINHKADNAPDDKENQNINTSFLFMNAEQKRAYLMMPILMFIGAPLTALLPTVYGYYKDLLIYGYIIKPVHYILCARAIGQLLAPVIFPKDLFKPYANNNLFMFSLLIVFMVTYLLTIFVSNLFLLLMIIIFDYCNKLYY